MEYGTLADDLVVESGDFELLAADATSDVDVSLTGLTPGTRYYYRVIAVNSETVTTSEVSSFIAGQPTSVDLEHTKPSEIALFQNYPNPFNPVSRIVYVLPEAAHVRVLVHNVQGQLVRVLADGFSSAGRHEVTMDAAGLASGVYIYSLEVNGQLREMRKMTLLE